MFTVHVPDNTPGLFYIADNGRDHSETIRRAVEIMREPTGPRHRLRCKVAARLIRSAWPRVAKLRGREDCHYCDGTGRDPVAYGGPDCYPCEGNGETFRK